MKKVICVIPARYASTRLPGKPLVNICGKPMIQWVWERAKKVRSIDEVIVATDDRRIYESAKRFNAVAMMTSKNCNSGTDRVAEVSRKIKSELVVNLQGDEPLIAPETISKAISGLINDKLAVASTPVTDFSDKDDVNSTDNVKVVFDRNGYALYFSRSVIPNTSRVKSCKFFKTIGLYVFRRKFLQEFTRMKVSNLEDTEKLEQLRILENGYKIKVVRVHDDALDVDVPENVRAVENRIRKMSKNNH